MNTKSIIYYVMLAVVILATVGFFFLFGSEEKTNLFYTNLAVVIVSEILLLGGGSIFLGSKKTFTPAGVSISLVLNVFAILLLAVVAVYSFLLKEHLAVGWYYGTLIVIGILITIIIGFSIIGAVAQSENNASFEEKRAIKNDYLLKAKSFPARYNAMKNSLEAPFELRERVGVSLKKYSDMVVGFPVMKVSDNPECYGSILKSTTQIGEKMNHLSDNESLKELKILIDSAYSEILAYK